MSERRAVLLLGATGLVGREVIALGRARDDLRLLALSRREVPLPPDARIEVLVADPAEWEDAIRALVPTSVICALGTTWRAAGRDEAAFKAVDQHLVMRQARAAHAAGARNFVQISAAGADPHHKAFYLRVKAEVESELGRVGFPRLDVLRPGLLRGKRDGDRRMAERLGMLASPLIDPFLRAGWAKYRSIGAGIVAAAALQCAASDGRGRFMHEHARIRALAEKGGLS